MEPVHVGQVTDDGWNGGVHTHAVAILERAIHDYHGRFLTLDRVDGENAWIEQGFVKWFLFLFVFLRLVAVFLGLVAVFLAVGTVFQLDVLQAIERLLRNHLWVVGIRELLFLLKFKEATLVFSNLKKS